MKRKKWSGVALLTFVTFAIGLGRWPARVPLAAKARKARAQEVPVFQVDPS